MKPWTTQSVTLVLDGPLPGDRGPADGATVDPQDPRRLQGPLEPGVIERLAELERQLQATCDTLDAAIASNTGPRRPN